MTIYRTPSRQIYGPPGFAADNKPIYRGGASAGSAPAWSPADYFTGGKAGLLIDGIASAFKQSAGGATSGNADPIGYVTDISGNANHLNQTSGALRQVANINGGVTSIDIQSTCQLPVTMSTAISGVYSYVCVMSSPYAGGSDNSIPSIYGPSPQYSYIWKQGKYVTYQGAPVGIPSVDVSGGGTPRLVIHIYHSGASAGQFVMSAYKLSDGSLIARDNIQPIDLLSPRSADYAIGFFGAQACDMKVAHQMEIGTVIDTTEFEATYLPYLVSRFAGWAP